MAADAVRWRCTRCKVSAGRIDGEPTKRPQSWTRAGEEIFCLSCSRIRAGEAADLAAATSSPADRARIRRRALIAFEIGRKPEAPNRTVAHACRTSSAAVAIVRGELERTTDLAPSAPRL